MSIKTFMITGDLLRSIANKYQTTEQNVRREYVQHLFLANFYRQRESVNLFFKGGTALRIIFQSPRFSEDLDFDTQIRNSEIENLIVDTLAEIERVGIKTEITESKPTSGGYLAKIDFREASGKISLELNISKRKKQAAHELVTVAGDFLPPYTILTLEQSQLVAEKISALKERGKPRDFFDLYFILRKNLLKPNEKSVLKNFPETIEKSKIIFDTELKQFLPKNYWPIIHGFKSVLIKEIERY